MSPRFPTTTLSDRMTTTLLPGGLLLVVLFGCRLQVKLQAAFRTIWSRAHLVLIPLRASSVQVAQGELSDACSVARMASSSKVKRTNDVMFVASLPADILQHICSFLYDDPDDLASFHMVNKEYVRSDETSAQSSIKSARAACFPTGRLATVCALKV
jgi:hypothetical protein